MPLAPSLRKSALFLGKKVNCPQAHNRPCPILGASVSASIGRQHDAIPPQVDILIVGGGIAGAGAAYELSASSSVVVLERESQCGYHSTGRSAASFTENYGNSVIRRLVIASRSFLESPPDGFCDHALMTPRGMLTIARADQLGLLRDELERARALVPSIHQIAPAAAIELVPVLRRDYVAGAIVEPDSRDLDVDGLHRGFLRAARKRGAEILTNAGVEAIERRGGRWIVETAQRKLRCRCRRQRGRRMGRSARGDGRRRSGRADAEAAHRVPGPCA